MLKNRTSVGQYEIVAALGAGGMGEVYRAKDAKLGREVALKILPASFTNDPDRVARFRREAQVLASLNHPHIAQIYGLEEANGTQFLVLELVDGESLDRRIARGPVPVDEGLAIAKQIAEALEAAHEKGIIHRDLKPANIALTKDGQVKVLDFGLAKAVEAMSASVDPVNSPTMTSPAMMTGVGVILGTAAYMSPEQAKGRAADKRSDVWAFGCVLFEMLTEKPTPFVATPFVEGAPMFSPDGRLIAYVSRETGRNEIYLRSYPGPGEKLTISNQGGNEPMWSPDGGELFYRAGDAMMAVDVTTKPAVHAGVPRRLFERHYEPAVALYANYSTVDGNRFVMIKRVDQGDAPNQINVVVNWTEELRQRIPTR
jgi:serine/threonine protein kinase